MRQLIGKFIVHFVKMPLPATKYLLVHAKIMFLEMEFKPSYSFLMLIPVYCIINIIQTPAALRQWGQVLQAGHGHVLCLPILFSDTAQPSDSRFHSTALMQNPSFIICGTIPRYFLLPLA